MKYVAFLRGINVGGNKTVKMSELKTLLEKMGYEQVRTLLNSGNVLFETGERDEKKLTKDIEDDLEKTFGWRITTILRSIEEIANILKQNPFKEFSEMKLYISFLSEEPEKALAKAFMDMQTADEKFVIQGREVYASLKGMGTAKTFNLLEKKLKVFATNRNINTVQKLAAL